MKFTLFLLLIMWWFPVFYLCKYKEISLLSSFRGWAFHLLVLSLHNILVI